MGALLALMIIVGVSLIAVRVGAMALMLTGLGWDAAHFQSYSAFFGVGFTTTEAELVVNHPVRRRIIKDLILAGNVGITSALATLVIAFVQERSSEELTRMIFLLVLGLFLFWVIWRIGLVKQVVDGTIHFALQRAGMVRAMDYELLLRVESGYCISEVDILPESSLAGKALREARPADRGLIILGVTSNDGVYRGAPGAEDEIHVGDVITVYGREEEIVSLAQEGKETT